MAHSVSHQYVLFLFAITAAGVVPCGGPKMSPRTPSILYILFWSHFDYASLVSTAQLKDAILQ